MAVLQGRCGRTIDVHLVHLAPCHLANIDPTVDVTLQQPGVDTACEVCHHAHDAADMLLCDECNTGWQKQKSLPPVNWRWVEEGGGYVRHEAWPHTPTVMEKHDCRVSPGTHQGRAIFTRAAATSPRPLVRRRQYLPRRGATGGIRTHDLNRLTALLYQLSYAMRMMLQTCCCVMRATLAGIPIAWCLK